MLAGWVSVSMVIVECNEDSGWGGGGGMEGGCWWWWYGW